MPASQIATKQHMQHSSTGGQSCVSVFFCPGFCGEGGEGRPAGGSVGPEEF